MRGLLLILVLLPVSSLALASPLAVSDKLELNYTLLPGWKVYTSAPPALVEEAAGHIAHEAEARGQHPSPGQLQDAARKRLASNEVFIAHTASGSHLDIDFSALEQGERPPTSDILRKSAEYAVQSLSGEEAVHDVQSSIIEAKVIGARQAFRIDARYRHHEQPVHFIGIIGTVDDQWFFFYFTAPGGDPVAIAEVAQILDSLSIDPIR